MSDSEKIVQLCGVLKDVMKILSDLNDRIYAVSCDLKTSHDTILEIVQKEFNAVNQSISHLERNCRNHASESDSEFKEKL